MKRTLEALLLMGCLLGCSYGQEYSSGQYPSSTRLFGVTYSPFALDLDTICLPVSQVQSDLNIIREVADHVRLYNIAACPEVTETVLSYVRENGMRAIVGLFLSGDAEADAAQIAALEPVLEQYGDIMDAILVGNEVVFLEIVQLQTLLGYLREVKRIVTESPFDIPVSTGEVWPVYESSIGPEIVEASDFLCMNMQPFWEGWDVFCPPGLDRECSPAGSYVHDKAAGLEDFYGKPVWVCESGWPTMGERCCEGRANARDGLLAGPSQANATIFINDLVQGGRAVGRPTYIHAIFDEDWKRIWAPCGTCEGLSTLVEDPTCSTCELDYHFGIYNFDRSPKSGVTLPA